MSIILFIIFALSLSALVIGCLAYTKKHQKPFKLPPRIEPLKSLSEVTCTKLGGIPIESGCEFPDTYAKGFKQCTGQITPNKVIIPWDMNEISRQCHTLFPKNPIDGPEPPPLTANSILACCGNKGARQCHTGGCCCNLFGCNCNNCEGKEGGGCDPACYQCGLPEKASDAWCYGSCGGEDELSWACDPKVPYYGCCGDCCQKEGCVCNVPIPGTNYQGPKKSCPW